MFSDDNVPGLNALVLHSLFYVQDPARQQSLGRTARPPRNGQDRPLRRLGPTLILVCIDSKDKMRRAARLSK